MALTVGLVDQLGRSPPWHGGGLGFKSRPVHILFYDMLVITNLIDNQIRKEYMNSVLKQKNKIVFHF